MPPVIAIDGPAGSGKSSVADALAERLGWHRLDSGLLYRIVAFFAEESGSDPGDADQMEALVRNDLMIAFSDRADSQKGPLRRYQVQIHGRPGGAPTKVCWSELDISSRVREEAFSSLSSLVAVHPGVRVGLRSVQRDCRRPPGLVAEGRDMGTVVFANAAVKVFLTASVAERARRRMRQLSERGQIVSSRMLEQTIAKRDRRDQGRDMAPLEPAADAVLIDGTRLSFEQVVEDILDLTRKKIEIADHF